MEFSTTWIFFEVGFYDYKHCVQSWDNLGSNVKLCKIVYLGFIDGYFPKIKFKF